MKQKLTAVLLSGGESSRFWPFTHKNLTPFLGKPLLGWHYDQLKRLGFTDVVVIGNKEGIAEIKRVEAPKNCTVSFVVQKEKGQGHALLGMRDMLNDTDKDIFVLNASDIYDDELLLEMSRQYDENPSNMYQGAIKVLSYFPGAYLVLDTEGNIKDIVEKPKPGTEPSDLVNVGIDIIPNPKKFLSIVEKYGKHPIHGYEEAKMRYIAGKVISRPVVTTTEWLFLKYPWHILSVMDSSLKILKESAVAKSAKIGKYVTIEGPVVIEDDVRICEGTKIVGPTFIGKGTIVGNNNMVRASHIGQHCVTGFNTDITRSYVGNNSWFHTNFIGDSVIGDNVSIGSGTVLANLRLDESPIFSSIKGEKTLTGRSKLGACIGDNVRIGVNVSIMPGVKVGAGAFIGAGVILGEDVPDATYCRMSPTVIMSKNTKSASTSREAFRKNL